MNFDHKEFITNPNQWAKSEMGRYCCLINKNDRAKAFILFADNLQGMKGKIVVALGNIFGGGTGELISYASVDALFDAGWRVD